jgi:hypothetical protein
MPGRIGLRASPAQPQSVSRTVLSDGSCQKLAHELSAERTREKDQDAAGQIARGDTLDSSDAAKLFLDRLAKVSITVQVGDFISHAARDRRMHNGETMWPAWSRKFAGADSGRRSLYGCLHIRGSASDVPVTRRGC